MIEVDANRFWQTIERSGEIGVGRTNGLARVALTADDGLMRDEFVGWCKAAGLDVRVDAVGSIFARRAGQDPDAAPVMVGSHLDTQVNGGKYDGIVGVLAALEVVRRYNDLNLRTRHPIEIVCWTNEEGARFSPPMIASGAFAGVYPVDWVLDRRADDGGRFGDDLERIGYAGTEPVGGRAVDAYFELHIEQGPLLDAAGIPVGVVTHGYTTHGFIVEARGETAHAGPWPMDKRKNALVGAAMLSVAMNEIGWRHHATAGKATASRLVAWPNKPGILSDWAQFTGDVRHNDPALAAQMATEFRAAVGDSARKANVDMEIIDQWVWDSPRFHAECIDLVRQAASGLNVPTLDLPSQAGHDAYHMARIAPSAMIFCPCREGITHNNNEYTTLAATLPGVNVLANAVLARAGRC